MPNTSERQHLQLLSGCAVASLDAALASADSREPFFIGLSYCVDCDYGTEPDGTGLCELCGGRCQ